MNFQPKLTAYIKVEFQKQNSKFGHTIKIDFIHTTQIKGELPL